ncbi:hypothetical protein BUALT_Bualt05G0075200 [Buddleja alternifolia]|uniref:Retrotransposon gag domain-containing protein n=1 Tax=Buddleja alternifolia TaxID=168488 RepID=A0AAV6XTH4_9LAMI|nr:hypothetical protein BUALT_Bualt05G0075200 [Buddleja alternifolia]
MGSVKNGSQIVDLQTGGDSRFPPPSLSQGVRIGAQSIVYTRRQETRPPFAASLEPRPTPLDYPFSGPMASFIVSNFGQPTTHVVSEPILPPLGFLPSKNGGLPYERGAPGAHHFNLPNTLPDMQEKMRKMRQRMGVNAPDPPKGVLFGPRMLADELPNNFRAPNVSEYDGSSDPTKNLWKFENCALLHQYSDEVKCRAFLTTLTRVAQQWFNQLASNFIHFFKEFRSLFLHQFASSKKYQKAHLSLFSMYQRVKEHLRGYIQRFSTAALENPSASADVLSYLFTQGLNDSEFFRSIAKKPPISFDNLLTRAEKYVNTEEATQIKRATPLQ